MADDILFLNFHNFTILEFELILFIKIRSALI